MIITCWTFNFLTQFKQVNTTPKHTNMSESPRRDLVLSILSKFPRTTGSQIRNYLSNVHHGWLPILSIEQMKHLQSNQQIKRPSIPKPDPRHWLFPHDNSPSYYRPLNKQRSKICSRKHWPTTKFDSYWSVKESMTVR